MDRAPDRDDLLTVLRYERTQLLHALRGVVEALRVAHSGPFPPYTIEYADGWAAATAFFHDTIRNEVQPAIALAKWDGALTRVELLELLAEDVRSLLETPHEGDQRRIKQLVGQLA